MATAWKPHTNVGTIGRIDDGKSALFGGLQEAGGGAALDVRSNARARMSTAIAKEQLPSK